MLIHSPSCHRSSGFADGAPRSGLPLGRSTAVLVVLLATGVAGARAQEGQPAEQQQTGQQQTGQEAAKEALPKETPPQAEPAPGKSAQGDPAQAQDQPVENRRTRRLTRERRVRGERSGEARMRVGGGAGYGRFEINARELGAKDSEDAAVLRLDAEFWLAKHIGLGITSEFVSTGDDLFEGQQVESGVGLRAADAQASTHDLAIYFAWDPIGGERFRLPLQVGPWFSGAVLDYDRARIDYSISTAGIRVAARPEITLVDAEKVDLVFFSGASYAVGFTSIYEDLIGNNETYDSESQQLRAEAGLRVDLRRVSLGLHYVYAATGVNLSDQENGRRLPEIDYDTNMFFFTIAGRF